MESATFGVVLEPGPEPWPFTEQRFVGDLRGSFSNGDEPCIGQDRHRARRVVVAVQIELRERSATADHLCPFAWCRQSKQDALGCGLPRDIESAEGILRQPCDGPFDASET